jgi:hemerythrin
MNTPNLPKTENSEIDKIHSEEHNLLLELLSIIDSGSDDDITNLFNKFIDHMQMHFKYEEDLMDKYSGYTLKELHKGEHYKVLSDAKYNLLNWRNFKDKWELNEYLKVEFVDWLNQHIEAMDIPMVEFFNFSDRQSK